MPYRGTGNDHGIVTTADGRPLGARSSASGGNSARRRTITDASGVPFDNVETMRSINLDWPTIPSVRRVAFTLLANNTDWCYGYADAQTENPLNFETLCAARI